MTPEREAGGYDMMGYTLPHELCQLCRNLAGSKRYVNVDSG